MNEFEEKYISDKVIEAISQKLLQLLSDELYENLSDKISIKICNTLKATGALDLSKSDTDELTNLISGIIEKFSAPVEVKGLDD